ncbi:MAG: DUF11 domain-containing protein, partial [Anaerolineales bacterium]|nr:DUF11 domain-containing protein [Anaerolineales bacterium]
MSEILRSQFSRGNTTKIYRAVGWRFKRAARWSVLALPLLFAMMLTLVLAMPLGAVPARAGTIPPFSIDGTIPDGGATQFTDPFGSVKELGAINEATAKLGNIHSDAVPTLSFTDVPGKSDLVNIWLDIAKDGDDDQWLYFAWEREETSGATIVLYEFQQAPAPSECDFAGVDQVEPESGIPTPEQQALIDNCNPWSGRSAGDFMIVFDFGGSSTDIILRTWDGSSWSAPTALNDNVSAAELNTDTSRGEGAVNLTDTIFQNQEACINVANILPGTVTGNSDNADYKDSVFGDFASAITISNCGTVSVTKVTDPAGLSGNFPYRLEQDDGGQIRYDGTTEFLDTLTAHGDSDLVHDLIADSDYTLSEDVSADPAWDLTTIICDGADVYPGGQVFSVEAGENTACTITNRATEADLRLSKEISNLAPDVGSNVVFTISVTNDGPADATGVTVKDIFPTGFSYVSHSGDGTYNSGTGFWDIGNLANGGTVTLNITATVLDSGDYQNFAEVWTSDQPDPDSTPGNGPQDPAEDDEDGTGLVTPVKVADLAITKSDNPDPVLAGNQLTYTVQVTNNGPSDALNVVVTDTLPAGVSYVSDTDSCVEGPAGTLTCSLGNLAFGAPPISFDITVTVDTGTLGTISNTASVSSDTVDRIPGNNTAIEETTVIAEADLAMDKWDDGSDAVAGTNYTYTLEVANNGPSDSSGSTVTDTLPAGWSFVSSNNVTCVGDGLDPEVVTCSVGPLLDGASTSFTITASVPADAEAGTVNNVANVTGNEPDGDPSNDEDTEPTDVVTSADLRIDKDDGVTQVTAGDGVTYMYTITVNNDGPSDADNVTVTEDSFPSGFTMGAVSSSQGGCAAFPCNLGTIATGGSATITVEYT